MTERKVETGFRRKVQRVLVELQRDSTKSPANKEYYNGILLNVYPCPFCHWETKFPETMTTPFIYCNNCDCNNCGNHSSTRCQLYQNGGSVPQTWGICRGCGFYAEIKDFAREERIGDGDGGLDRIEEWSVSSCCRRCAKQEIFEQFWFGGSENIAELRTNKEAYEISHANGIISKQELKKKIGKSGENALREAEKAYESALQSRKYSPYLKYGVFRARFLRNDFVGAEAAIEDILKDCGNFQPAIGALEKLIEQRMKMESEDDAIKIKVLDTQFQLLMRNCLGLVVSPKKLQKIRRNWVRVRTPGSSYPPRKPGQYHGLWEGCR